MSTLADVFIRLRADSRQIQRDVDEGVLRAGRGTAPRVAGATAGKEFASELIGRIDRGTRDERPKQTAAWGLTGRLSGREMGKQFINGTRLMRVHLDALDHRKVTPRVEIGGYFLASTRLGMIDRELDRIDGRDVHATVHIRTSLGTKARSAFGLLGLGGGAGFGGGSGAGFGAFKGLSGAGGEGAAMSLKNPYVIAGAAAAALASLPFIAQAAAGSIVFALGGAMATVAGIFAAKNKTVKKNWAKLTGWMGRQMRQVSKPFVGVINSLIGTARSHLGPLFTAFGVAVQQMAGPFQRMAGALIRSFGSPPVVVATTAVGNAFSKIAGALKPVLPKIVGGIANGVTDIANAVAANPKAFAAFVGFLGKIVEFGLKSIAWLTRVATWIERHWHYIGPQLAAPFRVGAAIVGGVWRTMLDIMKGHWGAAWHEILKTGKRVWNAIWSAFKADFHLIIGFLHNFRGLWHSVWNDGIRRVALAVWGAIRRGWSNLWGWMRNGWRLLRDTWHWTQDQLKIWALRAVEGILKAFSHIPIIGKLFQGAAKTVGGQLARMQGDSRKAWHSMQRDINNLRGKHVQITFGLHLPAGVSYPSRHIKGHAKGTTGAAPGWAWVGEKGPELVNFRGGEHVLSNRQSTAVAGVPGYAAGTIPGLRFSGQFPRGTGTAIAAIWRAGERAVEAAGRAAVNAFTSAFKAGPSAYGGSGAAKAFARRMLGAFGWGPSQWPPLLALWNQESGWNPYAVNPSSGAYGIPQALGHGHPYALGDYANQIRWGLNYIRSRYGSPANAWGHEIANNWYGNGGTITEPVAGVGLRTGQHYRFGERGGEQVTPSALVREQNTMLRSIRDELRAIRRTAPAETGAQIAGVLNGSAKKATHAGLYSTHPRGR